MSSATLGLESSRLPNPSNQDSSKENLPILSKISSVAISSISSVKYVTYDPVMKYIFHPITDALFYIVAKVKTLFLLIPALLNIIDFEEVKNNPELYLKFFNFMGFPDRVYYRENPIAVDAGGLSRQLISSLMQGIREKELIRLDSASIPTVEYRKDYNNLVELGSFYSLIDERNRIPDRNKLVIGPVLGPSFFDLVKLANSHKSEDEKFWDVLNFLQSSQPERGVIWDVILNPNEENLESLKSIYGDEADLETAKEEVNRYLLAAKAFYEGASTAFQHRLIDESAEDLSIAIQGKKVTKEDLKNALNNIRYGYGTPQEFLWLQEKIEESDDFFAEKFVEACTGQDCLLPGKKIAIAVVGERFFFHTCGSQLDLPRCSNKEEFLAGLEIILNEKSRFNAL
jgi:hypothetical protein